MAFEGGEGGGRRHDRFSGDYPASASLYDRFFPGSKAEGDGFCDRNDDIPSHKCSCALSYCVLSYPGE